MSRSIALRTALCIQMLVIIAAASDTSSSAYQKGTITQVYSSPQKGYDLKEGANGYQINNCGSFQTGQAVDYRVKEDQLFIRRDGGGEYKCAIRAKYTPTTAETSAPRSYQKGTIGGYEIRRDTHIGGGGGGANGAPGTPISTWTRHAKVYELNGTDLTYKVDYCGAFQAGNFAPGQVVEYRVDGNRLYIRHDQNGEYSCQIEGTRKPEIAKTEPGTQSAGSSPTERVPAATAATSAAKVSITSIPDGADIEVDGNFSGNTPSDLEVPEGEHSITVKKSGYKDWLRKMKVVAGSSIHLNAEMEKAAN